MEYCGGGSLPEIYKKHGPLPEDTIAFVSRETLRGLEYLHRYNTMHRDIKGANLLLTSDGDVKLSDFAISATLTVTLKRKSFIGTPYWMAPEVLAVEKKGGYNFQCDIWAVGITAIELAETQPPLFDLHPMTALIQMSKKSFKPETLKDKNRWSKEFQKFIKHLLVKDPMRRPTATQALSHPFVLRPTARKESIKPLLKYHTLPKPRNQGFFANSTEEEIKSTKPVKMRPFLEIPQNIPFLSEAMDTGTAFLPPKNAHDYPAPIQYPINLDLVPVFCEERQWGTLEGPCLNDPIESNDNNKLDECLVRSEAIYEHFPKNMVIYGLKSQLRKDLSFSTEGQSIYGHLVRSKKDVVSFDEGSKSTQEPPSIPPRVVSKYTQEPPSIPPRRYSSESRMKPFPSPTKLGGKDSCFSKIFHGCPLHINSTTSSSWVHPDSKKKYILIGSREGLYSLASTKRLDVGMEQMYPKKIWWIYIFKNVMLSITSSQRYMCITLLLDMYERSMRETPQHTTPLKGSKGTICCSLINNPFNQECYWCGITATSVIILQWHKPGEVFIVKVVIDFTFPYEVSMCEGLVTSDKPLPVLVTGVRNAGDCNVSFDKFDPNADEKYFTSKTEYPSITMTGVSQVEPDTVIAVHESTVKFVTLQGRLKPNLPRKNKNKISCDFNIEGFVKLRDSLMMFHQHGMQAKSLMNEEITAEIFEENKKFKLLGSQNGIILEIIMEDGSVDLYMLASK